MENKEFFNNELIDAAAQGSLSAVTALFDSSYNSVYKTIKTMVNDEDRIMDVIQDAYIKAIYNLNMLNDPKAFPAWVRKIAISNAAKLLKTEKPLLFSAQDIEEVESFENDNNSLISDHEINPDEDTKLVHKILDTLSDEERLVSGMYYYTGMRLGDIANMIGCDESVIKKIITDSREAITKAVDGLKNEGVDTHDLTPVQYLLFLFKGYSMNTEDVPFRASTFESVRFGLGLRFFKTEAKQKPTEENGNVEEILSSTEDVSSGTENNLSSVEDLMEESEPTKTVEAKPQQKTSKIAPAPVKIENEENEIEDKETKEPTKLNNKLIGLIAVLVVLLIIAVVGLVYVKGHSNSDSTSSEESSSSVASGVENEEELVIPAEGTETADIQSIDSDLKGIVTAYESALSGADAEKYVNKVAVSSASSDDETELYYCYYDVNSDGSDELLIGVGNQALVKIAAIYKSNDKKSFRIFKDNTIGDESLVSILKDGTIFYHKVNETDKDAEAGIWTLASDGASSSEIYKMNTTDYSDDLYHKDDTSISYNDLLATIQETGIVSDFDWKAISASDKKSSDESSEESKSESSEESSKEESSKEESSKEESSKEESSKAESSASSSSAPEGATDPYSIEEWEDNYVNSDTGAEMYVIPKGDGNYTLIWWYELGEYTYSGSVDGYQVVVNVGDGQQLYITPYSDHLDVTANFDTNFTGSFYKK